MRAIERVRMLKTGEKYWAVYAGEYTTGDGQTYLLNNPEAETVAPLYNLKTAGLQFEFLCFAYLWKHKDMLFRDRNSEYKPALDRYLKLRDKFKAPWYQQAKHVLPIEPPRIHPFTSRGDLDLDEVGMTFDEYADCDFIIYNVPLYDGPEWSRHGVELTPLRGTRV